MFLAALPLPVPTPPSCLQPARALEENTTGSILSVVRFWGLHVWRKLGAQDHQEGFPGTNQGHPGHLSIREGTSIPSWGVGEGAAPLNFYGWFRLPEGKVG